MASSRSLKILSTVTLSLGTLSSLVGACSSKSSSGTTPVDSGTVDSTSEGDTGSPTTDAGPAGVNPDEDADYLTNGLVACTPLEPGCYRQEGTAGYSPPTVPNLCPTPGTGVTAGPADTHCQQEKAGGNPPQDVNPASCTVQGDAEAPFDAAAEGPCGENGPDYGGTMFGSSGDDDDCKYHTSWTASPICQNDGVYFVVTATYQIAGPNNKAGGPLIGACTFAELCLNNTHPGPNVSQRPPVGSQKVVEGPPGTYTIGPVIFDEAGDWTVRFHFNEICCDVAADSPHGHAAYHITVPAQ